MLTDARVTSGDGLGVGSRLAAFTGVGSGGVHRHDGDHGLQAGVDKGGGPAYGVAGEGWRGCS